MSLLRDETGKSSAMRALLFYVVIPVLAVMTFASALGAEFPAPAWTVWGSLATMLTVGCFGPRIAQYLGPQVGAVTAAIKDSTIAKRRQQAGGEYEVSP